jgi:hypothetical protein
MLAPALAGRAMAMDILTAVAGTAAVSMVATACVVVAMAATAVDTAVVVATTVAGSAGSNISFSNQ